jgi:hypothetical protein
VEFDEAYWSKLIQKPEWFFEYAKLATEAKRKLGEQTPAGKNFSKQVRHFFEKSLMAQKVALGSTGPDWERERLPIDTIVIHHTSAEPGYKLPYMNATQLLNVYAPHFANLGKGEEYLRGQPIWSNHFHKGQQVFYLYHWLMRMDGSFERLLEDEQIGWHASNWDINKRSIGICLDNDYEKQDPTDKILKKLAKHIKHNYHDAQSLNIIGHGETSPGTICPGTNFLKVWKPKLLKYYG